MNQDNFQRIQGAGSRCAKARHTVEIGIQIALN
jgi:hypothetical protein